MQIELTGFDKQTAERLCEWMGFRVKHRAHGIWGWNGATLYRGTDTAGFITAGGRVNTPLSVTILDIKPGELEALANGMQEPQEVTHAESQD